MLHHRLSILVKTKMESRVSRKRTVQKTQDTFDDFGLGPVIIIMSYRSFLHPRPDAMEEEELKVAFRVRVRLSCFGIFVILKICFRG